MTLTAYDFLYLPTMREIQFVKYEGTGNDFILINNLSGNYDFLSFTMITHLCDRKFGIGADGLILINVDSTSDFYMDYFNADGSKSFCGNGSRCAVLYTYALGIHKGTTTFNAIDGKHAASLLNNVVAIKMCDVIEIHQFNNAYVLNTGSPHYVEFNDDLTNENIVRTGKEIRYSEPFKKEGINVNLVRKIAVQKIEIVTYERGVEDETLSCGTGATACALVHNYLSKSNDNAVQVVVKGGELSVSFKRESEGKYSQIVLSGPANFVFQGTIHV